MRRIGRSIGIAAVAFVAIGSPSSRSDDKPLPSPQAVDPVDRILVEWQAKTAAIQSLEVKFLRTDHSNGWGDTRFLGRAILAAPNLALAEFTPIGADAQTAVSADGFATHRMAKFTPIGADGKATAIEERLIWNGRSMLQFDMEKRKATRFTFEAEWPTAPSLLRLPFFYRMTVVEAKRDFSWESLREDPDRIFLKVAPKAWSAKSAGFQSCLIELDRKTFLPRQMIVYADKFLDRQIYKPIDIKINTVQKTDELTDPCLDAWTVSEVDLNTWPARLFRK